jgi:hypothetical protein
MAMGRSTPCLFAMEAAAATFSPLMSLSGARRSPTFLRCSPASVCPPLPHPCRCSSYSTRAERQLAYLSVPLQNQQGLVLEVFRGGRRQPVDGRMASSACRFVSQSPSFSVYEC